MSAVTEEHGNLVLSRKPGESIMLGDDIKLTVTKVRGERVWVAISAPRGVRVLRGELYVKGETK